jgi:putative hydrolase of the HAD superfamily
VKLQTVFLDAGGVLVFPNWERVSEALGRRGLTAAPSLLEEADQRAKHRLDCEVPAASLPRRDIEQEFFELVFELAGLPVGDGALDAIAELRAYHTSRNLWETVPDEVPPALDRLRGLGLRLVVVSNANGTLRAAFARLGLDAHVDLLIDSAEEGVHKPDRRLFEIALERSGARRETTVHLGDVYQSDVVGAAAAGIRPVLLDRLDLYRVDCPRVRSLTEFAERVSARAFDHV